MEKTSSISWILSRRSIRKYNNHKIDDSLIQVILRAAMYAPSASNCQPWHFIVSTSKDLFSKISEIHPHASFIKEASHVVLVCRDESLEHGEGYSLLDCGAATQNILLAANTIGIASCWIGIYPRKERISKFKDLFGTPDHIHPFALISLGYTDVVSKFPERFKPERIHNEHW